MRFFHVTLIRGLLLVVGLLAFSAWSGIVGDDWNPYFEVAQPNEFVVIQRWFSGEKIVFSGDTRPQFGWVYHIPRQYNEFSFDVKARSGEGFDVKVPVLITMTLGDDDATAEKTITYLSDTVLTWRHERNPAKTDEAFWPTIAKKIVVPEAERIVLARMKGYRGSTLYNDLNEAARFNDDVASAVASAPAFHQSGIRVLIVRVGKLEFNADEMKRYEVLFNQKKTVDEALARIEVLKAEAAVAAQQQLTEVARANIDLAVKQVLANAAAFEAERIRQMGFANADVKRKLSEAEVVELRKIDAFKEAAMAFAKNPNLVPKIAGGNTSDAGTMATMITAVLAKQLGLDLDLKNTPGGEGVKQEYLKDLSESKDVQK